MEASEDVKAIPDDVMKAAAEAQDAAMARCKAANFAVYEYPFNTGRAKDVLDEEIVNAILAERERAAKVAEVKGKSLGEASIGYAIASSIRSGAQP